MNQDIMVCKDYPNTGNTSKVGQDNWWKKMQVEVNCKLNLNEMVNDPEF